MEYWKKIEGYNGRYEVSDKGNIRSVDMFIGTHVYKGKILSQTKKNNGYMEVGLIYKGKRKFELVHRIVAKTFIPNPNGLPCVNHRDEVKTNNSVTNLEWCDNKYNSNYGSRINRIVQKRKLSVIQLTLEGKVVAEYPSIQEAGRKTKISAGHICHVCKGIRPAAGGYLWEYK